MKIGSGFAESDLSALDFVVEIRDSFRLFLDVGDRLVTTAGMSNLRFAGSIVLSHPVPAGLREVDFGDAAIGSLLLLEEMTGVTSIRSLSTLRLEDDVEVEIGAVSVHECQAEYVLNAWRSNGWNPTRRPIIQTCSFGCPCDTD